MEGADDTGAESNSRYLGVQIEDLDSDGVHHLRLRGELDLAAVPRLEDRVRDLCSASTTKGITLDLSGLSYIDSAGLAAIVLTGRLCAKHGHEFALIRGQRSVQRLFELTGMIDELPFLDLDQTTLGDESLPALD